MPISQNYTLFLNSLQSDKFHALWPAQNYVLQSYSNDFAKTTDTTDTPDLAIELPTGAGKTLIALLIAEAWRQENKKVAILSANKTLARQMIQEAQLLNIPAVLMEGKSSTIPSLDKRDYQRYKRIAIMNYWVYFNQNPILDPADLLIMDDAHLAEHCLHSLYSVEINRFSHENLFKTLITELQSRFPEYGVFADALDEGAPPTSLSELLSFLDQGEVANRFREIVDTSPYLRTDTDLAFRWKRIRHQLKEANIYVSQRAIWVRPYIYPLISNSQYAQTKQRLYMSATIGDPSDLSRRLGTKTITKIPVPFEYTEKTSGRRLIIMGRMEDEDLSKRLTTILSAALKIHPKSVWLCSSKDEAVNFQEKVSQWLNSSGLVGHPTWILTPLGDEIDDFKKASQGHLFVAGRFDGMDFRAEECRTVIVTKLPRAIDLQEEFISAYLRDASFIKKRLNQRIVQALGRCNRSDEDFGLYILADQRFANHFSTESNREELPRNIVAEIDMAQDSAEKDVEILKREVEHFLIGDFVEYDSAIQAYVNDIPPPSFKADKAPDTSATEVLGWTALFENKNYQIAANRFEECWDMIHKTTLLEIGALHGWHWAKTLYLQSLHGEPSAHEKSLSVLEEAIKRGGQSAWFNRMRASLNRARRLPALLTLVQEQDYAAALLMAFDARLELVGAKGNKFEKWCAILTEALDSQNHKKYQEGLEMLGQILGYHAVRPKNNSATDCLWRGVFGNSKEIITFEAKIEHDPSNKITAHDIGQAHNQHFRAEREYQGFTVRETIVTHLTTLSPDAASAAGSVKVLEKEAVFALWHHVKSLLSRYRDGWSIDDISARLTSSQTIRSSLPKTRWFIKILDTDERFINADCLCKDWS